MEAFLHINNFSNEKTNILELDEPSLFHCRVYSYTRGHSVLSIELTDSRISDYKPQYVTFDAVQYFEGSIGWMGANLCVKRFDTVLNPQEISNPITHLMPMFAFIGGNVQIKIWAGNTITISDSAPAERTM